MAKEEKKFYEGKIKEVAISEEMQTSYLDYAMTVIVLRALPDVRDGLKPVHRRILVTLRDLHLYPGGRFRKSAKICGDVSGNYHPHGEAIVYPSMVRLAQYFSYRYPLVIGQGNFGSVDGDPPAAMRYTEAKMAKMSEEMLLDLEKDTVNWRDNYDTTRKEPVVLPAKIPNLLVNGSIGIAVGMATNIPPHNLTEVCDATLHLIENPEATSEDLLKFVKGPDFPTGGIIFDKKDIHEAYCTGRGGIVIRGQAEIEEKSGEGFRIVITEIPYQVNKSVLLEKIANLVKDKKIEGIRDLRDESDKDASIRVVVELKKGAYPRKILNQLYKLTQLQEKVHVNMLALINGIQPKVLNLRVIIEEYIKHRKIIIIRRTQYELNKAKDRAHILEGLVMALESIDKIITIIKKSKDKEEAKVNLIKKFSFSERQTVAILEMKLQQLANLERIKVEKELEEKGKLIKHLEGILKSDSKILGIIKEDLVYMKDKYGDSRKTAVVARAVDKFSMEDLTPNESVMILLTKDGYIKRLPCDSFKQQKRGGKGVIGLTTKEEDTVQQIFSTFTHDQLLFFTSRGRVFELRGYEIPQSSRSGKGQAIVNFLNLGPGEKVTRVLPVKDLKNYKYLVMLTVKGTIKKVKISDFANLRSSGLIALKLRGEDLLRWVFPSTGKDDVVLVTAHGQAIRFKETDVRSMGRVAAGVRAIRLKDDDLVVGMSVVPKGYKDAGLLIITGMGFGKRTKLDKYKLQLRGGSGIKTAKITEKTGEIVFSKVIDPDELKTDLVIISVKGQVIRLRVKSVSLLGRATQGVRLMRFKALGDRVASTTLIQQEEIEEEIDKCKG